MRVAGEIVDVEGKQVRDSMGPHHGDKAGIVYFFAFDVVHSHKRQPLRQYVGRINKERECIKQLGNFRGCLLRTPAQTIGIERTSRYSPKLDDILHRDTGLVAA